MVEALLSRHGFTATCAASQSARFLVQFLASQRVVVACTVSGVSTSDSLERAVAIVPRSGRRHDHEDSYSVHNRSSAEESGESHENVRTLVQKYGAALSKRVPSIRT